MAQLKSLLNQNLTWSFSKKNIVLRSNDVVLLELREEKSARVSFEFDGKSYTIRNEGFWNPGTIIEKEGKQFLSLKRNFFGSKANIEFESGNLYSCKISNSPLAKLSFFNKDENEILYYKLDATQKPMTVLSIIDKSINELELLMMIVLGCYSFKGIIQENDDAAFILMVA